MERGLESERERRIKKNKNKRKHGFGLADATTHPLEFLVNGECSSCKRAHLQRHTDSSDCSEERKSYARKTRPWKPGLAMSDSRSFGS